MGKDNRHDDSRRRNGLWIQNVSFSGLIQPSEKWLDLVTKMETCSKIAYLFCFKNSVIKKLQNMSSAKLTMSRKKQPDKIKMFDDILLINKKITKTVN